MDKIVNELFEEIHNIFEEQDGGGVYLTKYRENQIKELIKQQLTITVVSQQRELLFSFIKQYNENTQDSKYDIPDFLVKDFLENNGG